MRLGIFGGTFNPPHNAHCEILKCASLQLNTDKILVIPAGIPPHKFCSLSGETRAKLCTLAFCDIKDAEVVDYEINKSGKSYTLETLLHFKQVYPDAEIYLIIGGDSLRDFGSWHLPAEIAKLCTLAVAERTGDDFGKDAAVANKLGASIIYLDIEPADVSSTELRLKYEFGFCVDEVTSSVDEYIREHRLYGKFLPVTSKLRDYLSPERLRHTFYVTKAGLKIKSDVDPDDVFLACALHDCAKHIEKENFKKYGFVQPDDMPMPAVHAFLGGAVAKKDFGITNEKILDAIRYHTTARPYMTELDMIVYVADKIEETRMYSTEHLIKDTLTDTFKAVLKEAYEARLKRGGKFCPLTLEALNFYGIEH